MKPHSLVLCIGILCMVSSMLLAQNQGVIGVDFDITSSSSVPEHWLRLSTLNWQKGVDLPLDDGSATKVDLLITTIGNNATYNMKHLSGDQTALHIQDLKERLGGASMIPNGLHIKWSDLASETLYTVFIFAHNPIGTSEQSVEIHGFSMHPPITFDQFVDSKLTINDKQSTADDLMSFGLEVLSSEAGTIEIDVMSEASVWLSGIALGISKKPCLPQLVLTDNPNTLLARASNLIQSSGSVVIDNDRTFLAPDIILNEGFCVSLQGSLELISDACNE